MRGLLAVAGLLCFAAVPAGQMPEGRITGHVRLTGRVRGVPLPSNVYLPRAVNSHGASAVPEIKNVVVYLRNARSRLPLPIVRQQIRQENESFVPRVIAITRGSSVDFPNSDSFFHNVFSLSSAANFDLGQFARGQVRRQVFNKPGLVKVYCHIHSQMSASILVLDHPYFAIPDVDGTFALNGVPPGSYTIVGWHERVGERSDVIEVLPGRAASVDLALPVEDAK